MTIFSTIFCFALATAGRPPVPAIYKKDIPDLPKTWSLEKAKLGKELFFDKRLSKDNSLSCASCHQPENSFAEAKKVAVGVGGVQGERNTPTAINRAFGLSQFWDGRAKDLHEQAKGPMLSAGEMAMTEEEVVKRVKGDAAYAKSFKKIFGNEPSVAFITEAIAAYELTIYSVDAPFDRYMAGDKKALNDSAQRGFALFSGKAKCNVCHTGPNFSDEDFHVLGVGHTPGRGGITGQDKDMGGYKTPTLRDITKTAPYMHDGSHATLEEVIDFYDRGGEARPNLDPKMVKLGLTPQEKADLVEFLKGLTGTLVELNGQKLKLPKK